MKRKTHHRRADPFNPRALLDLVLLSVLIVQAVKLNVITEQVNDLTAQIHTPVQVIAAQDTTPPPEVPEPTAPPQVAVTEQMRVEVIVPEPTEDEPAPRPDLYTEKDIELIGRTIWGEAGGVQSKAERAAVAWCILNRVDAFDLTIEEVVTAPHQFQGYRPEGECPEEHFDLAEDVLERWQMEKYGATEVGRTLPADCLYFLGDGERNHFTTEWKSTIYWGWTLADPYI